MNPKILIIDYGMGNLRSVYNALKFLGAEPLVSDKSQDLHQADAYILPGVGAFGEAMKNLKQINIIDQLSQNVLQDKKTFLGICLGMQLIVEDSEEQGFHKGLGWIKGHVVKFEPKDHLRFPHVGWNNIDVKKTEPLYRDIQSGTHYYFDHNFHVVCDDENISATCKYGNEIVASIEKDNIFATQFHPEKSQVNGLKILRNFLNYVNTHQSAC